MKLLEDESLRQKMADNSLRISKGFSEQAFAENMLELYERLIKERREQASEEK